MKKRIAIAIDLGTTTIAASIVDIDKKERLSSVGSLNPQRRFGADVISRLQKAVESPEKLKEMSDIVVAEFDKLIAELCQKVEISPKEIETVAIAGNSAMQHILLKLPVETLAYPPYRPKDKSGRVLKGLELGLSINPKIYIFPMPGGFVGGDTVAFMMKALSTEEQKSEEKALYIDIGTNGEITFRSNGIIWGTSAAAGPAFEGGNLSCGCIASPGAINSISLTGEKISVTTIDNRPAIGICGSAAIEALSEMIQHKIVDQTGRLLNREEIESNLGNRVIEHNGENIFLIKRDAKNIIYLSQNDIREMQLAKSAIRAAIEILLIKSETKREDISKTVLTGSFGAYLKPQWLETVAMLDSFMTKNTDFIPEGALAGVETAIFYDDKFGTAEKIAEQFKIIPLSGTPIFEELFLNYIGV